MASWFDTAMSDSVGVVWRAASGTVDPWTKQGQVDDATAAIQKASEGTIDQATAQAQATSDASTVLLSNNADPSQFQTGLLKSVHALGDTVKTITESGSKSILYIGIGVALLVVAYLVTEKKLLSTV